MRTPVPRARSPVTSRQPRRPWAPPARARPAGRVRGQADREQGYRPADRGMAAGARVCGRGPPGGCRLRGLPPGQRAPLRGARRGRHGAGEGDRGGGRALENGASSPQPLRHLLAFLEALEGCERERYLRAARALGERVLFTGRLDHEELAELLPACEALVVPSTFPESFGMVAVEAAACGPSRSALPIRGSPT